MRSPALMGERVSVPVRGLHLGVLYALAVSQPLLSTAEITPAGPGLQTAARTTAATTAMTAKMPGATPSTQCLHLPGPDGPTPRAATTVLPRLANPTFALASPRFARTGSALTWS